MNSPVAVLSSNSTLIKLCCLVIPQLKNKPDPYSNPNLTKRYYIKAILGKSLNHQLAACENARNALDNHATGAR